jgi:hypothetical protein
MDGCRGASSPGSPWSRCFESTSVNPSKAPVAISTTTAEGVARELDVARSTLFKRLTDWALPSTTPEAGRVTQLWPPQRSVEATDFTGISCSLEGRPTPVRQREMRAVPRA